MNNLLIPDEDIIVSKSPFSAYKDEQKVYDGRINPIPLDYIMFRVKRGYIDGDDFKILNALSELGFATSRMLTQHLNLQGLEIEQSKIKNRLKAMNKLNIISRFKFKSSESEPNWRAYCLEKAGKYLLMSRNYNCSWKDSDNTIPIDMMKEILARNQILLSYRTKLKNRMEFKLNNSIKIVRINKFLKSHLKITVFSEDEKEKENVFFEIIRSYDGYVEKTIERLKLYQEYYENFTPSEDMPVPPQLVLVGEDDKHIAEIFKVILKEKIQLKNMGYIYTSDLRVLQQELNKSVVNVKIINVDGKNKLQIKELNYTILK